MKTNLKFGTGAPERNRTLDLLITSELLYQLSYRGKAVDFTLPHNSPGYYNPTDEELVERLHRAKKL